MGLIKSGAWIADGITPCGWGRYSRTCYRGLSKSLDETMISIKSNELYDKSARETSFLSVLLGVKILSGPKSSHKMNLPKIAGFGFLIS